MKKKFLVILAILFLMLIYPLSVSAASCGDVGGTCDTRVIDLSGGIFCVDLRKWTDVLWGTDEPPAEFRILGVELTASELKSLIRTFITIGISLLAVGLIGTIFYGGFLWITAGDSEERLQKSRKVIKAGVIGLLITFGFLVLFGIVAAFLGVNITNFEFLDILLGE